MNQQLRPLRIAWEAEHQALQRLDSLGFEVPATLPVGVSRGLPAEGLRKLLVPEIQPFLKEADSVYWEWALSLRGCVAHHAKRAGRLVRRAATEFEGAGFEGAYRATLRFDPAKSELPEQRAYYLYARDWVQLTVAREAYGTFLVRLPEALLRARQAVRRAARDQEGELNFKAIGEAVGLTEEAVRDVYSGIVLGPVQEHTLKQSEASVESAGEHAMLMCRLDQLPPRSRELLSRYYGMGQAPESMPEIAAASGVSQQAISKGVKAARGRLQLLLRPQKSLVIY